VVRDPGALVLPPRERALAGLASLMTEAPWLVTAEDLDRMSGAGLADHEIVHAVTVAAIFSYFTRVADATGLEYDYESPLPRLQVDVGREPLPRPARAEWPRIDPSPRRPLSLRPATLAALSAFRTYVFERDAPLTRRERRLIALAAAEGVCDAAGAAELAGAPPRTPREEALASYAAKLTVTPWRMTELDLAPLRREGLDDRGLLDAISLVALQNMVSRIHLALGAR
jgi:alkylhydroperoxidase family enzyme